MSLFHTHLLLPLAERDRYSGLPGRLRQIRKFERMSEQDQREVQQQRLRRLLEHAYATVPYYRKQFDDANFRPSDARTDQPLPLPLLTRDQLRSEGTNLVSTAFSTSQLRMSATGGTTSAAVRFQRDLEGLRNKLALNMQLNHWAEYQVGDPVMTLWGAHRDLAMEPGWRWRLYEQKFLHRIPAPSGMINEEILERFRIRYEKMRPKVLYGYSTVLAAFALYLKESGLRHRPKVVIATAEAMGYENRKLVESVFGSTIYMHYGSRDIGMVSAECSKHEGMHFHPWATHVEFDPIGQTPNGPTYRLLITDLLNYGQPFIRYDTGDCVTLTEKQCSCGRWFPLVCEVLGRVADGFVLADGSILPGLHLTDAVKEDFRAILKVQFIQKNLDHIHLRYVIKKGEPSEAEELRSICTTVDSMMNQRLHWTLEEMSDIPRERSGKLRLCLSEVTAPNPSFAASLQTR
jgi:phenylacetate-CoA ligase